jgi:hypothetical protein
MLSNTADTKPSPSVVPGEGLGKRSTGIRSGHDRSQITDVHFAAKKLMGHRAADQRCGDIIEKTRKNPDHHQQNEPAFPIVRNVIL